MDPSFIHVQGNIHEEHANRAEQGQEEHEKAVDWKGKDEKGLNVGMMTK